MMTDSEALTEARDVMERLIAIAGASLGGNAPLVVSARKLLSAPAVGVKGLEWNGPHAETPFGTYHVTKYGKPWAVYFERDLVCEAADEVAAKAAAQADYDARIRSALVASPAPATAEPTEREPVDLWLKVHRLRTATMHGDPTDRARIVAAVMGDFTADDILTLQRLSEGSANGK